MDEAPSNFSSSSNSSSKHLDSCSRRLISAMIRYFPLLSDAELFACSFPVGALRLESILTKAFACNDKDESLPPSFSSSLAPSLRMAPRSGFSAPTRITQLTVQIETQATLRKTHFRKHHPAATQEHPPHRRVPRTRSLLKRREAKRSRGSWTEKRKKFTEKARNFMGKKRRRRRSSSLSVVSPLPPSEVRE